MVLGLGFKALPFGDLEEGVDSEEFESDDESDDDEEGDEFKTRICERVREFGGRDARADREV